MRCRLFGDFFYTLPYKKKKNLYFNDIQRVAEKFSANQIKRVKDYRNKERLEKLGWIN